MDIPNLKFPRDEIIEIIPAAYQNEAKRIHIPGLDPKIIPGSPQDIKIPVPGGTPIPSRQMTPIGSGLGSPAEPVERPIEKVINMSKEKIVDKVDDED